MPRQTNLTRRARELARTENIPYTQALARLTLAASTTEPVSPLIQLGMNPEVFQVLTNSCLENVGPYDDWTYTRHLSYGFAASVEDDNGEWRDSPAIAAPVSPTESSCCFCGETILMEKGDPWMHEETGEEHCEDSDEFATPQEDFDGQAWYPLNVQETEYITEDFLIGPFMMTYSAAVRSEDGRTVKCLLPSAEMAYDEDEQSKVLDDYWFGAREDVLAEANVYVTRLTPLITELGGVITLEEDGAPTLGHLLEVLVPIDNVMEKYPTASEWFTAFDEALNTRLPDEN